MCRPVVEYPEFFTKRGYKWFEDPRRPAAAGRGMRSLLRFKVSLEPNFGHFAKKFLAKRAYPDLVGIKMDEPSRKGVLKPLLTI